MDRLLFLPSSLLYWNACEEKKKLIVFMNSHQKFKKFNPPWKVVIKFTHFMKHLSSLRHFSLYNFKLIETNYLSSYYITFISEHLDNRPYVTIYVLISQNIHTFTASVRLFPIKNHFKPLTQVQVWFSIHIRALYKQYTISSTRLFSYLSSLFV